MSQPIAIKLEATFRVMYLKKEEEEGKPWKMFYFFIDKEGKFQARKYHKKSFAVRSTEKSVS